MPIIFILVISLIIVVSIFKKKGIKEAEDRSDEFWARENDANFSRKKDISNLDYLVIPFDDLPFFKDQTNPELKEVERTLLKLKDQKIIDLSNLTNTDIKIEYGAANLTILSEADQNYTVLVRTLEKWATLLVESNQNSDAISVLEYAISINTAIGNSYKSLCKLYLENGERAKAIELVEKAKALDTPTTKSLIESLTKLIN